ncbi:flagellar hook-length control protein FliK [Psychromonas arctica]|uniref:Flagellar hook-length control protein FliK n=1 Tax=Psychromonas arctica TaxID=168275 RepID=A0ABU9H7T6_9GAMM
MVQSLLLNNSTSLKNSELKTHKDNVIVKKSEGETKPNELTDKQQNFSEVLKESIEKESKANISALEEASIKETKSLIMGTEESIASENIENELNDLLLLDEPVEEAQSDNSQGLLSENEQKLSKESLQLPLIEQVVYSDNNISSDIEAQQLAPEQEINEIDNTITSEDYLLETASSDFESSDINIQEIQGSSLQQEQLLSSIQAAQQINTNVKNTSDNAEENDAINAKATVTQQFVKSNETNKVNSLALADKADQVLTNKANQNNSIEKNNILENDNANNNLALADKAEQILTDKANQNNSIEKNNILENDNTNNNTDDLKLLTADENDNNVIQMLKSEKSEGLPNTLKVDTSITQAVVDVNGAKPIQTNFMQTDKLVAVNQQAQANNNLLDQPLDIQSKQAASAMGERVMMMISQGKQEVQIRLDPAELGSMFVKVQIQQDQVQLNIQTQAAMSKDIIEQNMPRLREQLAQQGIQLGEANVEQQPQQSQQHQQHQQNSNGKINTMSGLGPNNLETVEDNQTAMWMPSQIASKDQGIDYYA